MSKHRYRDIGFVDTDARVTLAGPRIGRNLDPRPQPEGRYAPYVPLDQLPSRAPEAFRAHTRLDPHFSVMWDGPVTATWEGRESLAAALRVTGAAPGAAQPARLVTPEAAGFFEGSSGRKRLAALGSVLSWRTLNADQLAACSGDRSWLGHTSGRLPVRGVDLFGAFMLDSGAIARTFWDAPTLIRPGAFTGWPLYASQLSAAEWLHVTGGIEPTSANPFPRHNVLMTELALRIAEFVPACHAMLGEQFSRQADLFDNPNLMRLGDGVMVRRDGLRIVLEMTSAVRSGIEPKVQQWAKLLETDTTKSTVVVFVTTKRIGDTHKVLPKTMHAVGKAVTDGMGRIGAKLNNRVFVADWGDWFGEGSVSSRFPGLPVRALRAGVHSGFSDHDNWRDLDIGDPAATPWTPGPDREADNRILLRMAPLLAANPHWLVPPDAGQILNDITRRWALSVAGFDAVPRMPPVQRR